MVRRRQIVRGIIAPGSLPEPNEGGTGDPLLPSAPDEWQPRGSPARLPLDRQLVCLRPPDLEHLGGLLHSQERGQIVEHLSTPLQKSATAVLEYARHSHPEVKHCCSVLLAWASMVGRKRTRGAEPPPPSLTAHQIVAYNFARARDALGWTQVETSERLEPFLGYKLNQAGISAIERTYDSDRRRNIDVAEIVAFARCFNVPLGWFFLPPATHAQDLIEPVNAGDGEWANAPVAELIALAIGTPRAGPRSSPGWPHYSTPTPTR